MQDGVDLLFICVPKWFESGEKLLLRLHQLLVASELAAAMTISYVRVLARFPLEIRQVQTDYASWKSPGDYVSATKRLKP